MWLSALCHRTQNRLIIEVQRLLRWTRDTSVGLALYLVSDSLVKSN